jgi:hypothetical protein
MGGMNKYRFALREFLDDMKLSPSQACARYGFNKKGGKFYISRQGFHRLCNHPAQIKMDTINILCIAMGVTPADLWRAN